MDSKPGVQEAEAAVSVRVLRFFDALTRERASVKQIVLSTSAWLGRSVAVRLDDTVSVAERGEWTESWPDDVVAMSSTQDGVVVGLGAGKPDEPYPDDDQAILDRLAVCVTFALSADRIRGSKWEKGRAVQTLISGSESDGARRAALEHLGLRSHTPVRIVAAHGTRAMTTAWIEMLEAGGVSVVSTSRPPLTVLLTTGGRLSALVQEGVPQGLQVGLSQEHPAIEAPDGLGEALAALRFSQPSPRDQGPYLIEEGVAFEYWRLRGYDALAEALTPEVINRVQDVTALDRALAGGGPDLLRTLDVVVAATSIRQAARSLDTHHNTVAHRVAIAEQSLGFSLADSYGRCRLYVAIVLRRLRETASLVDRFDKPPGSA